MSREENAAVKVVVFSQWTSMLDLVQRALRARFSSGSGSGWESEKSSNVHQLLTRKRSRNTSSDHHHDPPPPPPQQQQQWGHSSGNSRQLDVVRFDGSMTQVDRTAALRSFNHDTESRVLLISLKAGGVGELVTLSYAHVTDCHQ